MRINKYFKKIAIFASLLLCLSVFSFAQTANFAAPREEKLLNGLKLMVWSNPQAAKTSVKVRIHSGSAFDPQTKEGLMSLLADILFPTDSAKEFFTEDLGGSLEITSTYDYIQVSATGTNDQALTILETLANTITKPQIDKDTTARVKAAKLAKVRELEKSPSYMADQAVAKRLFGNFPYGRPQMGTSESLAKIDFADILLAEQKFLTADNATITISGNINPDLMFRAARRYFGGWEKSDKKIPATFTQPDAPDTKLFLAKTEVENTSELRYAFRGLARNDKDFAASQILTKILQNRLQVQNRPGGTVRQQIHLLPGFVVFQFPNWNVGTIKIVESSATVPGNTFTFVGDLLKTNVEPGEFEKAKNEFSTEFNNQDPAEIWLDADTFKLASAKDERQKVSSAQLDDVQRVLERWRKESVVTTLVASASK